jgi:hypothetical protein
MVQCATLIFAAQLLKDPSIKFGLYASCEIDRCSNYNIFGLSVIEADSGALGYILAPK